MIKLGEFTADGYGMAIIATDLLTEYLKAKKCRARKLLSYLDKNKAFFYQMIKDGKILPFYKIPCFEYEIFISVDENEPVLSDLNQVVATFVKPRDYREVFRYNGFYLEVGDLNRVCIASFDYLEYYLEDVKQNITDKEDEIPTGPAGVLEKYYSARGFNLQKGIYQFDLIGLKRIQETDRESKNYGYLFIIRKDDRAVNDNFEKADNDKHCFDVMNFS